MIPAPPARNKALSVVLGLVVAWALLPAESSAQNVTSDQVRRAVESAVAYLKNRQDASGFWAAAKPTDYMTDGATVLATLALLNAGLTDADPAVRKALAAVDKIPNEYTYVTSLKCQAYAAAGGETVKYRRQLEAAAAALVKSQLQNGMWSYKRPAAGAGRGDNSNTQFALLGLHEAAKAGVRIPRGTWDSAKKHFEYTQLADGGWMYVFAPAAKVNGGWAGQATGTMTAAALSSLYICGQRLLMGGDRVFENGVYPSCGKYTQNRVIAAGLKWLATNFNQGSQGGWALYYLYGVERVGMLSGMRNIGPHDWYRQGAGDLIRTQRADGSWGPLYDTAFGILFLAKGNRPVLFQKLQWEGDWNRNRYDLENLTIAIGARLGKPVTWQSVTLDSPLAELRQSPILYITGHSFPKFTDEQRDKLRQFVQTGGTLLADACCGSAAFRTGFEKFAAETFSEYRLRPLDASHPLFGSYYDLKETYDLQGIDVGCRTGVIFSPRALSCLWELRTVSESTLAFKLGTNIAAYATGKESLADKLDAVELPPVAIHAKETREIPRGAVRVARLAHGGDYDADVHALANLAALLRDKANVDVVSQPRAMQADDPLLFDYPVVFMTGHYKFELSAAQVQALRTYLQRGGVLVADACCGSEPFDRSFRALMKQLFPNDLLTPLPADHPIYAGKVGVELGEMHYRQLLANELKARGTMRPPIEAITLGGRTCVLYSRYDFCCGLEGDNPFSCRGYVDADARKLAMDLFLFAISY